MAVIAVRFGRDVHAALLGDTGAQRSILVPELARRLDVDLQPPVSRRRCLLERYPDREVMGQVVEEMRLTAAVTREGPLYAARCLEVEVASQGLSFEQALTNVKEALDRFFEDHPDRPAVVPPVIAPVEVSV